MTHADDWLKPRNPDPAPRLTLIRHGRTTMVAWSQEAEEWMIRAKIRGMPIREIGTALNISRKAVDNKFARLKTRPDVAAALGAPPAWLAVSPVSGSRDAAAPKALAPPKRLRIIGGAQARADWTPESLAWLIDALSRGMSYGECAQHLGVTRSTIAGKVSRIRSNPDVDHMLGDVAAERARRRTDQRRRKPGKPSLPSITTDRAADPAPGQKRLTREEAELRRAMHAQARADLAEQRAAGVFPEGSITFREWFARPPGGTALCRFTLSDTGGMGAVICAKPVVRPHDARCAWCADHHALVYYPATKTIREPDDRAIKRTSRFFGFGRNSAVS